MANIIKRAADNVVDSAHEIGTNVIDTAKGVADSANQPTQPQPTLPDYVDNANNRVQTHPQTGEKVSTHDYPFIRLTDENNPIRPGKDRLNPYVMRGRHHEFQHLANILEDPLPGPIHLITGPPGYGKSTMVDMVKEYGQRIGFVTVTIEPEQFTSTETLIEHIRREVLGPKLASYHTQTTTDANTGGSGNATIDAKLVQAGIDVQHNHGQSQTQEPKGNPFLLHHLHGIMALVKQYSPGIRGLLFLCDEFQGIANTIDTNTQAYVTARRNLQTLNEGFHRGANTLPITTFLAGLTSASSKLEELLIRPDVNTTELLPIDGYPVQDPDSTHCAQIIQDYILAGQKAHHHHLQIHPRYLYHWGHNCKGHPIYAAQVGTIIQNQLHMWHENGQTSITPENIRTLATSIHNRRETYYARRIAQIKANKSTDVRPQLSPDEQDLALHVLQHIMALITHRHAKNCHEQNPIFNTWQAAEHVAKSLSTDRTAVQNCLDKLIAIGAIRNMQFPTLFIRYDVTGKTSDQQKPQPEDPDPSVTPRAQHNAYLDSAIPSLTRYVLNNFPEPEVALHARNKTNQEALATFDQYQATRWPWTRQPELAKIPAYEAFTYNPPRTPLVLTPAQAETRQKEIDMFIHEQHNHWVATSQNQPWPRHMPQIPDDDPKHKVA